MRFFLDPHGCAKNQVDAELLHGILLSQGWEETAHPEEADLVLVNSCAFIEEAKTESIEAVLAARASCPGAKILLTGCLSQRYGAALRELLPEADGFFGNGDLSRLPEVLAALFSADARETGSAPVLVPPQEGVCCGARPKRFSFPRSAYVKLTEGCSNFCSFCAIPVIRGPLRSRTPEAVAAECAALAAEGVFELNLVGQDLAAFGTETLEVKPWENGFTGVSPLCGLLTRLAALPGDFRIRLLYLHPDHFPLDILPVMAADRRFLPYFDLPFQSGDEDLLRKMNRKGNAARYSALLDSIRRAFSSGPYGQAVVRTTFITGFPGETDGAFAHTQAFLSESRFLWAGVFCYSREEDTAAFPMKPAVPKKKAAERREQLLRIQEDITAQELARFIGQEITVLVEEPIPPAEDEDGGGPRLAIGRAWFQAPEVDGSVVLCDEPDSADAAGIPLEPGSVVRAKVLRVCGADLEAAVLHPRGENC